MISIAILLLSIVRMARSRPRWWWPDDDVRLEADLVVHALITEIAGRAAAARDRAGRAGVAAFPGRAVRIFVAAHVQRAATAAELPDEVVVVGIDRVGVGGVRPGSDDGREDRGIRLVELLDQRQDARRRSTHPVERRGVVAVSVRVAWRLVFVD